MKFATKHEWKASISNLFNLKIHKNMHHISFILSNHILKLWLIPQQEWANSIIDKQFILMELVEVVVVWQHTSWYQGHTFHRHSSTKIICKTIFWTYQIHHKTMLISELFFEGQTSNIGQIILSQFFWSYILKNAIKTDCFPMKIIIQKKNPNLL